MDIKTDHPTPRRQFVTVKQLALLFPCFSEASLRWLIYKASSDARVGIPDPNLVAFIFRVGRKVLIDQELFVRWIEIQNQCRSKS